MFYKIICISSLYFYTTHRKLKCDNIVKLNALISMFKINIKSVYTILPRKIQSNYHINDYKCILKIVKIDGHFFVYLIFGLNLGIT